MSCYESPKSYAETEIYKNASWWYIFGEGGAVKVIYLVCVYKCAHVHMCAHVGPKRGNVKGYMVRS